MSEAGYSADNPEPPSTPEAFASELFPAARPPSTEPDREKTFHTPQLEEADVEDYAGDYSELTILRADLFA